VTYREDLPAIGICSIREGALACRNEGQLLTVTNLESGVRQLKYLCPFHATEIAQSTEMPMPGDTFIVEEPDS
jgi:hypothetical protein